MRHPWLAYVVVALLAIGAGVAIAGLPNDDPVDATIVVPSPAVDVSTTSDAAPTTEADTTEPPTSTTTTTVPASSSTSSTSPTTTTTSTTSTSTLPADELPPRSDVTVIVANGANISGAAARNVELLRELGYTDIAPRNGSAIFDFTTVFYADGFDDAAARLADDLDLLPEFVAPLADAPPVIDLPDDVQLLAYIGLDRAG